MGWLGSHAPGSLPKIIHAFISRCAAMFKGSEREVLLDDLGRASIAKTMDHDSIIIFDLRDYQRPPYAGQSPYRVEGRMLDRDGTELTAALYADRDGHLLELEFIRWGVKDSS